MPLLHKEYSKRAKYTPELLKDFNEKNNTHCYFSNNSENNKIDRNSRVKGPCISENCKNLFETDFRRFYEEKRCHCKVCSKLFGNKKREETCNKIYGISHTSKREETKDKTKETCEKKYGGKSPAHSQEVKAKMKETNDNKSPEEKEKIIKKRKNTNKQTRGIEHFDYSKEALYKLSNELNIILLDDEYNEANIDFYDNVTRDDIIYYKCIHPACEIKCKKNYRQLKEISGPFCNFHTTENMVDKYKNTYISNTGYDHPMHNPTVVNTVTEKLREIYNDEIKSEKIREQTKQTNLKNNGVEFPMQSKKVQDKCKLTCIEKYGVEHPAQNEEIMQKMSKNAYKRKDYILSSGNIIKIQGYEHYALDELLQIENVDETDIIIGNSKVPEIWYEDKNNKQHRHYVDIFIQTQNRMIEVKSTWTAEKKKDCIFLKQEAGKKLGYKYEIWVYNSKGEKVECYK